VAKIRSKINLLLVLLLTLSLSLTATVQQSLEQPDTLLLGSKIYLTLSAEVDLASVTAPDTLSSFSIIQVDKLSEKGKPVALKLTILALDTGAQTFPALQIKAVQPSPDSLFSQAFSLKIRESRNPQDSTLVDIAGSQKLRGELPWWAYYLIGGLLVLCAIALLLYLILRRKKPKPAAMEEASEPQDLRPAWQKALDAMQELKVQTPATISPQGTQSTYLLFHFRLSEIIKLFLEEELDFKANEMTTREIRQYFRRRAAQQVSQTQQTPQTLQASQVQQDRHPALHGNADLPSAVHDNDKAYMQTHEASAVTYRSHVTQTDETNLLKWLESCDRVKFARHEPTVVEYYTRLDEIIGWLQLYGKRVTAAQAPGASQIATPVKTDA
jgi:hypothetical protein